MITLYYTIVQYSVHIDGRDRNGESNEFRLSPRYALPKEKKYLADNVNRRFALINGEGLLGIFKTNLPILDFSAHALMFYTDVYTDAVH